MTYSPLLPTPPLDNHRNDHQNDHSPDAPCDPLTVLTRLSHLLYCPAETSQLWTQVLSLLGQQLRAEGGYLVLLEAGEGAEKVYRWGNSHPLTPEGLALLWRQLHSMMPAEIDEQWRHQGGDLQLQLFNQVKEGLFHIQAPVIYPPAQWPCSLRRGVGDPQDRRLVLLPLAYQRDAVGWLALWRQGGQPEWSASELKIVASAGSQIYLAMQRSRIENLARTRSAYDRLTQLPDRMLFSQQLSRALRAAQKNDVMLGVAFLDLDRFKNINDTLGHEAGDCLLQQVAERLQGCLRDYDVVSRWGGDEFTLLLSYLRSPEDVSQIAQRILQRLAAPFSVQGQELYVTASLGIALAPYDGDDEQTLLRNADAAMYQAKGRGRNNFQLYFEEINADARSQLNLETDLRKALDTDELFLCYQPQVDLRTGQWIGLEALIRWQHPTLGLISPGKFIPIAEDTGLIEPIGRWVLQAACAQYQQWRQQGMPKLRLAINLSAQQFQRSYLVRSVMQILNATGFDPGDLELEVTESAAMQDVGFAVEMLKKLSHSGIQIAMDDFGTGYSSLSVLKRFPLDTLKIDRSFVIDLVNSPSDAAIASTIIALAKMLNFKVLAEGVETAEQVAVLTQMGCDYAQGYWFSRPLGVAQIADLLDQGTFHQVARLAHG